MEWNWSSWMKIRRQMPVMMNSETIVFQLIFYSKCFIKIAPESKYTQIWQRKMIEPPGLRNHCSKKQWYNVEDLTLLVYRNCMREKECGLMLLKM